MRTVLMAAWCLALQASAASDTLSGPHLFTHSPSSVSTRLCSSGPRGASHTGGEHRDRPKDSTHETATWIKYYWNTDISMYTPFTPASKNLHFLPLQNANAKMELKYPGFGNHHLAFLTLFGASLRSSDQSGDMVLRSCQYTFFLNIRNMNTWTQNSVIITTKNNRNHLWEKII